MFLRKKERKKERKKVYLSSSRNKHGFKDNNRHISDRTEINVLDPDSNPDPK